MRLILLLSFLTWLGIENEISHSAPKENPPKVEILTNHGRMVIQLYDETPLHRDNFIKLVESKTYDSLLFHRVIGAQAVADVVGTLGELGVLADEALIYRAAFDDVVGDVVED